MLQLKNQILLIVIINILCCKNIDNQPIKPININRAIENYENEAWELVWSDEFNTTNNSGIDLSKWSFNTGGHGWGNHELQYYTDRLDNAYIENGCLVIKANKEEYNNKEYTSARLVTKNKGDWLYGKIEIRAKLPYGQGIWPAFWMLPTDNYYGRWPRSGEIDIMELLGNESEKVYGTLIYGKPYEASSNTYSLYNEKTFSDDFHVFGMVWKPEGIYWYIDGQPFHYETNWYTSDKANEFPAPFNTPFHLILNIAVGGSWPGRPDESTFFPQYMYIDYVHVYQITN